MVFESLYKDVVVAAEVLKRQFFMSYIVIFGQNLGLKLIMAKRIKKRYRSYFG